MQRRLLTAEMMRRNLSESVEAARVLIESFSVTVGGVLTDNPDRLVSASEPIEILHKSTFVGRGGEKLDFALHHFALDVSGLCAVDVGSSTGGFTDCLLQRGASYVFALDVGTNQLHESLRVNPRVSVHENTNVRDVDWNLLLSHTPQLAVVDVSFISLKSIADKLAELHVPIIVLVKPQFESTATEASKSKGVIKDPNVWLRTLKEVVGALESVGLYLVDVCASPLRGAQGNVEFLAYFVTHSENRMENPQDRLAKVVDTLH